MADLRALIAAYLDDAKLMALATAADDRPWACSVWFAADEELNIYWFSSTTRRHSDEVARNPQVAGAIALPQTPDDPPRGVQFEGVSELLVAPTDVAQAKELFAGRIFSIEKIEAAMASEDRPHRFHRITPMRIALLDAVNFPDAPLQVMELA